MVKSREKLHWSVWLGRLTLALGIVSVVGVLTGAIGSGLGWWHQRVGMNVLFATFIMAVITIPLGLTVLALYHHCSWRVRAGAAVGLVLAGGYVAVIVYYITVAMSVPAIHDISTDLENPPRFTELELRQDNRAHIPGSDDPQYRGMNATERWRALHAAAYGDITTLQLPTTDRQQAIAIADRIARGNGWDIAVADPDNGRMEATDTVSIFGFKDDVVVRAQPDETGQGSIIDVRSVSRFGESDLGVNAERVRRFLSQIESAANSN